MPVGIQVVASQRIFLVEKRKCDVPSSCEVKRAHCCHFQEFKKPLCLLYSMVILQFSSVDFRIIQPTLLVGQLYTILCVRHRDFKHIQLLEPFRTFQCSNL